MIGLKKSGGEGDNADRNNAAQANIRGRDGSKTRLQERETRQRCTTQTIKQIWKIVSYVYMTPFDTIENIVAKGEIALHESSMKTPVLGQIPKSCHPIYATREIVRSPSDAIVS